MYEYTQIQWLLIFYIYCFFGWLFESAVVSVQQRKPVNRGFLKGPLLPIYGFGATIMLHVSLPLLGWPAAVYAAGLVTATAFEYVVGVLMESLFKVRYWDYSDHKFQFQGRICLDSSIAWGFLSLLLAYVLHQPVARFITGLNPAAAAAVCAAVSVWFVYDTFTSAKAAFEFARVLEEVERLRAEAEELRVQLRLGAYEAQDRLEALRGELRDAQVDLRKRAESAQAELRERLETAQSELRERTQEGLERLEAAREERKREADEALRRKLAETEASLEEKLRQRRRHYRSLLRANPSARSARFAASLRLWREREQERDRERRE